MGFLCKLVSVIRVLQCSFRMPVRGCTIAIFVMLCSSPMCSRRKFVMLGGFPMRLVHIVLPPRKRD